jgi:hypothetical protein
MEGGTQVISPASVIMVNTPLSLSQRPLRASLTVSVSILMGEVLQKPHRGFSRLVFDLPPNPSIDHLVAVILKYPR